MICCPREHSRTIRHVLIAANCLHIFPSRNPRADPLTKLWCVNRWASRRHRQCIPTTGPTIDATRLPITPITKSPPIIRNDPIAMAATYFRLCRPTCRPMRYLLPSVISAAPQRVSMRPPGPCRRPTTTAAIRPASRRCRAGGGVGVCSTSPTSNRCHDRPHDVVAAALD